MLLPVLGLAQQVGEGQRLQGAGPGRSRMPEGVRFPRVPPASDRAERPGPHAARGVDAVDADHCGESAKEVLIRERLGGELLSRTTKNFQSGPSLINLAQIKTQTDIRTTEMDRSICFIRVQRE